MTKFLLSTLIFVVTVSTAGYGSVQAEAEQEISSQLNSLDDGVDEVWGSCIAKHPRRSALFTTNIFVGEAAKYEVLTNCYVFAFNKNYQPCDCKVTCTGFSIPTDWQKIAVQLAKKGVSKTISCGI
ncbi:hypothetical protein [Pseudobacteriovorax antillogorgiicola]|uniref:Beta/Gamma crystallin n=1 Tax=Pseudobacteriovorax antillogorgiicola TaxID=1513793 RepID=A0A1Y6CKD1_9BACT|nr:hypothetical protein [Pseudobacteriovorax antillogorgiicola]TCS46427.1 hypothetical protein EDD56_12491 [Pseudobacteriovorax antillogorgiicola]SMF69023.1 hypothetical protein SAMN06296036_12491 [Pseudobacteriovorax antillogorgiicola]